MAYNTFAYSGNNPINYIDPTGHAQVCAQGDLGGGCGSDGTIEYIYNTMDDPNKGIVPPPPTGPSYPLGYNALDLVPVVNDVRSIIRGSQTADQAAHQPGFIKEQEAYQTWVNNCYSVCHGASPEPGSPLGGPMPDIPLVDEYSQGAGEAAGGAVSLLIDAAYAKSTTNIFAYGGKEWHVGWQTNDEWSIIHVGNAANPTWGGIHLAIGSIGPRQSFFHIYVYPNPHFFIKWH